MTSSKNDGGRSSGGSAVEIAVAFIDGTSAAYCNSNCNYEQNLH